MNTIKIATITEHYSMEEASSISLHDVVTRPGFQKVMLRKVDSTGEIIVGVQYIDLLQDDSQAPLVD